MLWILVLPRHKLDGSLQNIQVYLNTEEDRESSSVISNSAKLKVAAAAHITENGLCELIWRWCSCEASQTDGAVPQLRPPAAPAARQLPASSESSDWGCSRWSPGPGRCCTRREPQLFCLPLQPGPACAWNQSPQCHIVLPKCHIGNKVRQFHPPLLLCVCSWQ